MTTRPRTRTRNVKSWSKPVTEHSHAMDLEPDVFKKPSARAIAESVKRSAEHSDTRKSTPLRSAMSMLNFYVNRAGSKLPPGEHTKLNKAKDELRKLFKRSSPAATTQHHANHHGSRSH
jgi:hypothetical protein